MEKQYKTIRSRMQILRSRGMNIETSKQRNIIKKYSYYNLVNAYKTPFLEDIHNYPSTADRNEDYYVVGTTPEHLEALFKFDSNLRLIFLKKILEIEEKLKNTMVQSFYDIHTNKGKNKSSEVLHRESEYLRRIYYNTNQIKVYTVKEKSGHVYTTAHPIDWNDSMREAARYRVYFNDTIYDDTIAMIYFNIGKQRKKKAFIKKYLDEHTYLPMWVLMNILTFGNVSKLFNIQTDEVKEDMLKKLKLIGGEIGGFDFINFSRIIEILGLYRNITAHNERFFCTRFSIPIDDYFMNYLEKLPFTEEVTNLQGSNRYLNQRKYKKLVRIRKSIYTIMFCISLFLSSTELERFKKDIQNELKTLKKVISERSYSIIVKEMGLDFDWDKKLIK